MKYINTFREGMHISDVYLCKNKQIALTKAGKEYGSLILQDKTGTVDAKIWDLGSPGVGDFDALDYVHVDADVTIFQGSNQLNVKRIRRAEDVEYIPEDYLPVSSKSVDQMYGELEKYIASLKNQHLRSLASSFFIEDKKFAKEFKSHSAAKSVHHGFVGGLLEHTLSVVQLCDFFAGHYPALNRDLLLRMTTQTRGSCWATSSSAPRWSCPGLKRCRDSPRSWRRSWFTASWPITASWSTVPRKSRRFWKLWL